MSVWMDPPGAARVIPLGEPIDGGTAIFEGSLQEAREFIEGLPEHEREKVAVWTPGHVFSVAGLLAEQPGHEHDPLPRLR